MLFGLTNFPRVFYRFIKLIFLEIINQGNLLVYLDNILIAIEYFPRHLEILKEFISLAAKYGLHFRLSYSFFCYREVEYLGYLVSEHGIQLSLKHVNVMLNYLVPKNQRQVRQFLSLVSYFRQFIQNFSIIS